MLPSIPGIATEVTTTQRKLVEQKIKEARIHMRTIISSSNGFIAQPSLSEKQPNLRNNQLLEVFPEGRSLLKRLFEISVCKCERIATTNLFYLLSFDATVRSLLPGSLLQPLERLCNNICSENLKQFLGHSCSISPTLGDFASSFYIGYRIIGYSILMHLIYWSIWSHVWKIAAEEDTPQQKTLHKPRKNYNCLIPLKLVWHIIWPIPVQKSGRQENFQLMVRQWEKMTTHLLQEKAPHLFLWFCPNHGHCYGFISLTKVKAE